jgi:ornithine cyclodeaminase
VIVVSEAQTLERLSPELVFRAVKDALIAATDGSATLNSVVMGHGLNDGEVFAVKSGAAARARIVGLKIGSYWPGNTADTPRHASTIVLLDPDTGHPAAIIEATKLNGPRTAAADAVAADALARSDASVLTIIGAGHQAAHEVRALCAVRPIKRVMIGSRTPAGAKLLRDQLAAELRIDVETADLERGCREADILVTVTPSRAPLFDSTWLKPGVHVATMGSDQQGKQELPLDLLKRARLFCDLPSQSLSLGEFQHVRLEVESGAIALTAIGDVLTGRAKGRRCNDETTVFDSSGLALQDLFVAVALLRAGGDFVKC